MIFFPVKQVIKDNRSWLLLALLIFIIAGLVFYYNGINNPAEVEDVIDNQLDHLLAMLTRLLETNPVIGALLVFMNNFLSMAQMLVLGAIAGISPLFTLGVNGALIGSFMALAAQQGLSLSPMIIYGILPHGILELPAFFLCGALGLKFGYHCIASPLPGKTRMESFRYIWKEAISIIPLIVLLLLAAAFIEMFITPQLLNRFI